MSMIDVTEAGVRTVEGIVRRLELLGYRASLEFDCGRSYVVYSMDGEAPA